MPTKSANLKAILTSPSYLLAERDVNFLARPELRPVRMQLELLKPEMALAEEKVASTIVPVGVTQVVERDQAQQRPALVEGAAAATPGAGHSQRDLPAA